MGKSIYQEATNDNCEASRVKEEFSGKNLTRFRGSGLVRRFSSGIRSRSSLTAR